MYLKELWRYPVKSMAGEKLESVEIGPLGLSGDRALLVVDGGGRVQTARNRPGLLRHRAVIAKSGRVLIDGLDWESPEVADMVRAAAGPGARLRAVPDEGRFDVLPLMVTTDGAIAALGVDHRRLRPNVVIGGVGGLAGRGWEGGHLAVGSAVIGLADLRARCIMTTWDPETGVQDVGVLQRIRRVFGGTFALNAWAAKPGRVAVGDPAMLLTSLSEVEAPRLGRYTR